MGEPSQGESATIIDDRKWRIRVGRGGIAVEPVREWRAALIAEGVSPTMAAKAYRLLQAILMTAALEDRPIPRNPCQIRGADKEHSEERPVLTVAQVLALAETMPYRKYRALNRWSVTGRHLGGGWRWRGGCGGCRRPAGSG